MASGFGAGAGADMLQDVLKRKFLEQVEIARQQQFAAKLAQDDRQFAGQQQIAQGNLTLGNRRVDEESRQFNEQAPVRMANVKHIDASTGELLRKPQAEQADRDFTTQRDAAQRDFTSKRDATQHGYQMQEIGSQGANALRVANVRHPDAAGQAQTAKEQNEVADAIALIDQIGADSALNTAVGPLDQYVGVARDVSGVNRFDALHKQLVGKLSLAQAGKLKGQGQISDKERAMLGAAATALNRGLSEQDYKNELAKIRAQFERMRVSGAQIGSATPAAGAIVQEFDYVPGKGLVPRKQ